MALSDERPIFQVQLLGGERNWTPERSRCDDSLRASE
jgi:hypothetical protein